MKSYRDLEIFKVSKHLAIEVHKMSLQLPKIEMYEEGSQLRRSSKAIPTAIAEGYSRRRYKAEFVRYLVIAQAECDETIIHLDFLYETGSLTDKTTYDYLNAAYDALSKRINTFIQWVEKNFTYSKPETSNRKTGN